MTFDVKLYGGAVGDGVTDDTAAIQKTINDAAAMLKSGKSPGPIYFPPSDGPYKVDTLTFPDGFHGWLYSLFDNGLYANRINIGSFNAFVGRSSTFFGGGTLFPCGPMAKWLQWQKPTNAGAFVDMDGTSEVYFEGLSLQTQYSTLPVVRIHNDSKRICVNLGFERCEIGGSSQPFAIQSAWPDQAVGFDLRLLDCSVAATGSGPALSICNYGRVKVRGGYMTSAELIGQPGLPFMDGYRFEDILSENLTNHPWLTVDCKNGQVSNLVLDSICMADSVGATYLVLNKTLGTSMTIRNCGWNDGLSLVDPASIPNGLSGIIESMGARATEALAKQCFQWAEFKSTQGPAIYYGNPTFLKYIGPAMKEAT